MSRADTGTPSQLFPHGKVHRRVHFTRDARPDRRGRHRRHPGRPMGPYPPLPKPPWRQLRPSPAAPHPARADYCPPHAPDEPAWTAVKDAGSLVVLTEVRYGPVRPAGPAGGMRGRACAITGGTWADHWRPSDSPDHSRPGRSGRTMELLPSPVMHEVVRLRGLCPAQDSDDASRAHPGHPAR